MRSHLLAAAIVAATAGLASAQSQDVTIHGCVVPGQNGTYVMTKVAEVPGPSGAVMPAIAHGRRVAFWLKNDDEVKKNPNRMVEVSGTLAKLSESEAEIKGGVHKDGGVVIEFEGPGRDVRVSNEAVGNAVGTAGRTGAESNDVKMMLAEVNVKSVKVIEGSCQ